MKLCTKQQPNLVYIEEWMDIKERNLERGMGIGGKKRKK